MRTRLVSYLLCLFIISGCTTRQFVQPPSTPLPRKDFARIILEREPQFVWSFGLMQIKDNDQIVGKITTGGKLEWDRKPGMMILSITPSFGLFFSGSPPLQIYVEPEFEYHINVSTQGFVPKGVFSLKRSKRYTEKEAHIAYVPKPAVKDVNFENIQEIPDFKAIPRKNDVAVLIGIENYQNIPKSDFSKSDSGIVKYYLKALGFQERNIELLTDEKATFSAITKSLEAWLPNRIKKNSMVFIYYSGHGSPDPASGDAYIDPYDVDLDYLTMTGYPLKRLYSRLEKLNANEVIVVLDSCFSGAGGRSILAKGARPLVIIEPEIIPQNMVVLSAAQSSHISISSPEKGYGIFTYYFLKAIKDGKKNIAEIYEHIKPLVEDEAKRLNVNQSPSVTPPDITTLKERFYLRK